MAGNALLPLLQRMEPPVKPIITTRHTPRELESKVNEYTSL